MPTVRSYSEWIHRVNAMTSEQLRTQKPLEDLRDLIVRQWEDLLSTFRHGPRFAEKYKRTVHVDPMELDPSLFSTMETMVKKRIERLYKINLDISMTTKNVGSTFSKKFQRLEKEEAFYLETTKRVDEEVLKPLSRMRYQLALYQTMGMKQQLAKERVKR